MPDQPTPQSAVAPPSREWLIHSALVALTATVYGASLGFEFVWDDFDYLIENYRVQGLSPAHWRAMWLYPSSGLYSPIHQTALALLYQVAGLEPFPYHLAQMLLHAACACALLVAVRRIESARVAAVAAALFVVHPANIENVAWVTETKSTLALLFFLLSLISFLRHGKSGHWREAVLCVALFALSLLSKPSTVVAPGVILLLALTPAGRPSQAPARRRWILIGVLFASSALLTLQTLQIQAAYGAGATPDRLAEATLVAPGQQLLENVGGYYGGRGIHLLNLPGFLAFYLKMTLWPAQLSVWQMFPVETGWSARAAAQWLALLLAAAAIGWAWFSRSGRGWAFWALWFLVFLLPVLQIVPNPIWVADRYLYIPAIGLFVLFAKLIERLSEMAPGKSARRLIQALPAVAVLTCAWTTLRHLPVWRTEVTLWTSAMHTCYRSAYCHDMLGQALRRGARQAASPEEAARLRLAAVEEAALSANLHPTPQKFIYLGDALTEAGDRRALDAYAKTQEMMGRLPAVYWSPIIKAHYRFDNLPEAQRLLGLLDSIGADDPALLLVRAFVDWKQDRPAEARAAIRKIMDQNTLVPYAPDRTLNFISHYWGDRDETSQMLREIAYGE